MWHGGLPRWTIRNRPFWVTPSANPTYGSNTTVAWVGLAQRNPTQIVRGCGTAAYPLDNP